MNNSLNRKRRKHIGSLLHIERKCNHYTQEQIAQKLGVGQDQISKIESGDKRIDIAELIAYCEEIGLSPKEFAAKIETRLHAEGLLKRPKKQNIREPLTIEKIRIDVFWRENHYSASFGENIPGKVVFTAYTFVELQNKAKECLDLHVTKMTDDGVDVPQWLRNSEYEFQYKFLDARSLLTANGQYLSLAAISRLSGINQNQLSLYANGKKKARLHQLERIVDAINKIGKGLMTVVP